MTNCATVSHDEESIAALCTMKSSALSSELKPDALGKLWERKSATMSVTLTRIEVSSDGAFRAMPV